jgi:hypothetical protein
VGIEPTTYALPRRCSTPELLGPGSAAAVGGRGRIRTPEGLRQLIYSQPRLTTSVPARPQCSKPQARLPRPPDRLQHRGSPRRGRPVARVAAGGGPSGKAARSRARAATSAGWPRRPRRSRRRPRAARRGPRSPSRRGWQPPDDEGPLGLQLTLATPSGHADLALTPPSPDAISVVTERSNRRGLRAEEGNVQRNRQWFPSPAANVAE